MSETKPFKKLARKYGFQYREDEGQFIFIAENHDDEPVDWISLTRSNLPFRPVWQVGYVGNTDHLGIWFCDTRKDLTPKKIVLFVKSLSLLLNWNLKMYILIDPEDWQEIAKVNDAYEDERWTMGEDVYAVRKAIGW